MNGMTQKELEQEKLTVERMCLELKAKRQVSPQFPCFLLLSATAAARRSLQNIQTNVFCSSAAHLLRPARTWWCS